MREVAGCGDGPTADPGEVVAVAAGDALDDAETEPQSGERGERGNRRGTAGLKVVGGDVADIAGYDSFYKRLIASIPLKNVTSRFAMEKIKSTTTLPIPESK